LDIGVSSTSFQKNDIGWPQHSWPQQPQTEKVSAIKGQLISKCLFEKIVWTKIPTKNLIDSAQQV